MFTIIAAGVFLSAAAMLNRLAFIAGTGRTGKRAALLVHKRWTSLSHIVLGWCLSSATRGMDRGE